MTSCQTTSHQNFADVTISKHVTAEQENVFIVFNFVSLSSLFAETLKRVAILMITNISSQIAKLNRIQKPPSGAGFFRGG